MKTSHVENDYIDNPSLAPATESKRPQGGAPELAPTPARCDQEVTHHWISFSGRPSSVSSSSSSSSTSSDQRLLDHTAPPPVAEQASSRAVRLQPKVVHCKPLDLKGPAAPPELDKHFLLCEACGKCKCKECASPRTLPSCWVCNQECLCSAQTLVSYSTCMCLVQGIFYHCTNEDDEGSRLFLKNNSFNIKNHSQIERALGRPANTKSQPLRGTESFPKSLFNLYREVMSPNFHISPTVQSQGKGGSSQSVPLSQKTLTDNRKKLQYPDNNGCT